MKQSRTVVESMAVALVLTVACAAQGATFDWSGADDATLRTLTNWTPNPTGGYDFESSGNAGDEFNINSGGRALENSNHGATALTPKLTVNGGGMLTHWGTNTFDQLHLNGGSLVGLYPYRSMVAGTMYVDADSTIGTWGGSDEIDFTAAIVGSAKLTNFWDLATNTGGTVISNNNTGFSGDWHIVGDFLRIQDAGALGDNTVDVEIDNANSARLWFNSTYNVTVGTLTLGGVEFHNLSNFGTGVGSDTYDITQTYNGVNFADFFDGSGTVTVSEVPEPATMSLLVLGGLGALIRRRRQ